MSALHLKITTPSDVMVDSGDVRSVRAEDASGGFGVLPGHADLLTVLSDSVVRWRDATGRERYCAVRGGVLSVAAGQRVTLACRQAVVGDDLDKLNAQVAAMRAAEVDTARRSRVEQTRLHARAVRQLMRYLRPASGAAPAAAVAEP